ncbi:glycosyltransferase family 2 protein [Rhodobacter xanthinilyticus]|uniref:glycosyltransferase family 2 protein n=1 Tax=Rhodobacter xanthinilyticus TaxID=1850250 RepID=UPI000B23E26F|nr:glycosyltransferase family 2 protein [Rhodobacter xanthinilyticus]
MSEISISCVIAAYNEAPRIGAVLGAVAGHPALEEVIVVDDGSRDGTAEVVAGFSGVRLLAQPQNGGKSRAVARGIAAARGSHLLLLDADLRGLDRGAVSRLIAPVDAGAADVSLSLRANAPASWRALGLDYISGERVLPRAQLADRIAELEALPRFGLEVFLNRIWLAEAARIAVVRWPGVESPMKHEKRGWRAGLVADAKMMGDIFRTIPPREAAAQILRMRARRIAA